MLPSALASSVAVGVLLACAESACQRLAQFSVPTISFFIARSAKDMKWIPESFHTATFCGAPGSYPQHPLHRELAAALCKWAIEGEAPLPCSSISLLVEPDDGRKDFATLNATVVSLRTEWSSTSLKDRHARVAALLEKLGPWRITRLLSMRRTAGSVPCLPARYDLLMEAAHARHSMKSDLTVAGRALSKHAHRDASLSWWGVATGKTSIINERADDRLLYILSNATWINAHLLPHSIVAYEVRCAEGYGARWARTLSLPALPQRTHTDHDGAAAADADTHDTTTLSSHVDGSTSNDASAESQGRVEAKSVQTFVEFQGLWEFRGFLEPPMEGGHEQGWKH